MTPKKNKFDAFEKAQHKIRELDFQGKDIFSSEMLEAYKLRNSFGLDPDTEIHRIFQKNFYEDDQRHACLTLPLAASNIWNVPLENPLADVTGFDPITGKVICYGSLVNRFYALCWTNRSEPTELDWENFSHGKDAVRISTTVGRLLDRLVSKTDRLYMHRTWITTVEYKNPNLIRAMKSPSVVRGLMESTGGMLAASAAIVETRFSNEDEVRLLFDYSMKPDLPNISCINNGDHLRIPFDWKDFVVQKTYRTYK